MNRPFCCVIIVIIVYIIVSRGVFFSDLKALLQENFVFHICGYIQKILFTSLIATIFIGYVPKQMAFMKNWNRNATFQIVYDICFVTAGIYGGARLITRVVQGTCPPGTSDWQSQVCNTNGAMKELPNETLLAAAFYNLATQVIFRSSSPTAILLAWIFNGSLINVALYLVQSPVTVYINLMLVMLCMTSYEIERGMMKFYVHQKLSVASAEANTKLKIELIRLQMDDEKRALVSKREMVRHIAHEIRTPLNIVTVATDVILAELNKMQSVPQFVFDTLNNCQEACAITCEIVNDLLNFEKLAAGLVTLEKTPTVLATYTQRVLNPFYVSAGAKNLVIDYQYTVATNGQNLFVDNPEDRVDVVDIDSVKMSSVLRNLLSNAIKFAKKVIILKVSIIRELVFEKSESDDDQLSSSGHAIISVKDDGAGISSTNLSRLFQEGIQFNANELQKGGGSGFGLYIAKSIVDLHTNSRMWAESEGEGKGATFFVKLPLSDTIAPPRPSLSMVVNETVNDVKLVNNTSLRPLVILVVDDSAFTRRLTIQLLKQICGDTRTCTFLEAVDGQEAVACVIQSLVAPSLNYTNSRPNHSGPASRQISAEHSPVVSKNGSGSHTPVMSPRAGQDVLPNNITAALRKSLRSPSTSGKVGILRGLNTSGKCGIEKKVVSPNLSSSSKGGMSSGSGDLITLPERRRRESFKNSTTVQIDIVFMDYNMPRMVRILILSYPHISRHSVDFGFFDFLCYLQTGPVATNEMRRWGYTGPIIGVSGDTDVADFLEAGANTALVKPINRSQLEGALCQHVSSWHQSIFDFDDDVDVGDPLLSLHQTNE